MKQVHAKVGGRVLCLWPRGAEGVVECLFGFPGQVDLGHPKGAGTGGAHGVVKRLRRCDGCGCGVWSLLSPLVWGCDTGALAVVDKTLHVLSTELRGIKCVECVCPSMLFTRALSPVATTHHAIHPACVSRQIKEELHRYRRLIADTLTQSFRDTAVGLVIVGHHGSDDAGPAVTENGSSPGGWGEVEAARFGRQLDAFIRPQLAGLLRVNGLLGAVSHYRVKLKAEVKNTVRSVRPHGGASREQRQQRWF